MASNKERIARLKVQVREISNVLKARVKISADAYRFSRTLIKSADIADISVDISQFY